MMDACKGTNIEQNLTTRSLNLHTARTKVNETPYICLSDTNQKIQWHTTKRLTLPIYQVLDHSFVSAVTLNSELKA